MSIVVFIIILLCLIPVPAMSAEARELDYAKMAESPARELYIKAVEYQEMNDIDNAMAYYLGIIGAFDVNATEENRTICAKAYNELGKAYFNFGHYSKAFDSFASAIKICEANGFMSLLPHIYNNLGSIYCTWNDQEQGLHYFKKAFEMTDSSSQPELYCKLLINIIGAESSRHNEESALRYYNLLDRIDDSDVMTEYFKLTNKGVILMVGSHNEKAMSQLRLASEYAERHNLPPQYRSYTYTVLGDLHSDINIDSALYYYHKALSLNNPAFIKRGVLKGLAVMYRKRNPVLADKYTHSYLMLTDSIFNESEINKTKGAQFIYEMEKNLQSIRSLSHDKEIAKEQIKKQRLTIIVTFTVLAIILTLSVMLIRRSSKLQKANRNLFERSKVMLRSQEEYREREKGMSRQIDALKTRLAEIDSSIKEVDDIPTSDAESVPGGKIQSADRLSDNQKQEILRKVLEVTETSPSIFDVEFSLEMLADMTGVNSKYVSKVINEFYGCNFRAFINEIRIREAQRRLLDTDKYGSFTIKAIAESVGYKSHANFILLFKKYVGLSPSQYQKMATKENE